MAQRHEGVLQLRAPSCVGVYVTGGHTPHAEPPRQRRQRAVARAVVARVGTLQLHAQTLGAEGVEQPPRGGLVVDTVARAAGEAHEALGVFQHGGQRHVRLAARAGGFARVVMRKGEDAAEIAPAARIAHKQGQVPSPVPGVGDPLDAGARRGRIGATAGVGGAAADLHIYLGAVDRAHSAALARGLDQLHRTGHGVVIGERQRRVPSSAAAPASSCGSDTPSRKEYAEWQCSST